jgi:hypothetical protein
LGLLQKEFFEMSPCPSNPVTVARSYLLNELEPSDAEAFRLHLAECESCRDVVADILSLARGIKRNSPEQGN